MSALPNISSPDLSSILLVDGNELLSIAPPPQSKNPATSH